jgi:hypothetical protein
LLFTENPSGATIRVTPHVRHTQERRRMKRPRGRPKTDVETGVIAVRLPKTQIEHLDHYVNLLAS